MKATQHPHWATCHRKPGTELRYIKERYYLYEYKTIYDPTTKKPKKVSGRCLGSITEEGFKASSRTIARPDEESKAIAKVVVKDFGVALFILKKFALYSQQLKTFFPNDWTKILAMAYCRFVHRSPLKNMPFRLETSFMYELFDLPLFTDKTASEVLNSIGKQPEQMHHYMKSFVKEDDYILIDGTSIVSKSQRLDLAQVGYNTHYNYDGQLNLLYIYSASSRMPIFYRLVAGNITDVKAFKHTLTLSGIKNAVVIADKGFYSKSNIDLMEQEALRFIIPLKRDNALIDYKSIENNTFKTGSNFFKHESRFIWFCQIELGNTRLHLFLDEYLRVNEENDYLNRIKSLPEEADIEKFQKKKYTFGTIALLATAEQTDSQQVYQNYKSRMFIETMFDGLKNVLEADRTYMQNSDTLQGWMFINHICLQWYQEMYVELKEHGLINKISVNDYIQTLNSIKKVSINGSWQLAEFTKNTNRIIKKLGIDLYNT
jgi:transposase